MTTQASCPYAAVVIGGSAGSVDALSIILSGLPAGYPLPVLVVIHLPAHNKNMLPEILSPRCALPVLEAEDKASIMPGTVYIAPPDYHLLVERNGVLSLSGEEEVLFSRPSIDVLFESAADVYGPKLIGVVITGANDDASRGAAEICAIGGTIVVQNPETAYCRTMPEATLGVCPQAHVLSLEDIGVFLREAVQSCP